MQSYKECNLILEYPLWMGLFTKVQTQAFFCFSFKIGKISEDIFIFCLQPRISKVFLTEGQINFENKIPLFTSMASLIVCPVSIMSSTTITLRPDTDPDKLIFLCRFTPLNCLLSTIGWLICLLNFFSWKYG